MRRRTFLAAAPTIAFAGCLTRLGLADRVEIAAKFVVGIDDGSREVLAERRYDPGSGPSYEGAIDDRLADDVTEEGPLIVSEEAAQTLRAAFDDVEYGIRGCEVSATRGDPDDCREATLVLADFNDLEVGDVADVRFGDPGAGVVSVHRRREERD